MKYAAPFLLNGGLLTIAKLWLGQTSSWDTLVALFVMLGVALLLNSVLAIIYLLRNDMPVGLIYLVVVLFIVYIFKSMSGYHGKMVNG